MNMQIPEIPPEDEKNPTVNKLVEFLWYCMRIIKEQGEKIVLLEDEIARLKGQKPRPKFSSSKVAKDAKNKLKGDRKDNQSFYSRKQRKTEEKIIQPDHIPEGAIFKGYENYYVQDLRIESVEIRFRLAVYVGSDGSRIRGELPSGYRQGHFSAELIAYCLSQYYQCHVTEPLLLEQLHDMGIDISSSQLSNILIKNRDTFHEEKEDVLRAGLNHSEYINVDDTGAKHQGKNGYCTTIGSHLFTYFSSTQSKSRINFLKVLQGNQELYVLTEESLNYAFEQGINDKNLDILEKYENRQFDSKKWEAFLNRQKIESKKNRKVATEAALLGGALKKGLNPDLVVICDGAGQFAIFLHQLCWVHEERHYRKLIPISEKERIEIETVRSDIWDFYEVLKKYKELPNISQHNALSKRFDEIFSKTYKSTVLNSLLANSRSRKEKLLLVLKYPSLPLHNNDAERDIREYVKRRKISGSTRSEDGRKARDTFTSLKKTCQKLGIAFCYYLMDRITEKKEISKLSEIIVEKSKSLLPA